MHIGRLLLWLSLLAALLACAAGLAGARITHHVERLEVLQARAEQGSHHAHALLALGEDYLLHQSPRAARQWYLQQARLQQMLADAPDLTELNPDRLRELRQVNSELVEVFAQLQGIAADEHSAVAAAQRAMLADSLIVDTQRLSDGSYQLSQDLDDARRASENDWHVYMRNVALGALVLLLALAALVVSRILRPLAELRRVTNAVRAGDLRARSSRRSDDEFGDLARDFNAMTEALQQRTERLQDNERQLRVLTERLPALVAYVDPQGRYQFCSGQFERSFGLPVASILGRTIADLIDAESWAVHRPRFEAALAGPHVRFEVDFKLQGRPVHCIFEYVPEHGAGGEVIGFHVMALDISERIAAERSRDELKAQLREAQKMESIGTLAGGIAHDFNNILASILGNLSLATSALPADNPVQPGLAQVYRASLRARDLVQQILAFSRRRPHEQAVQAVDPIVREAHALLRSTIPAGIELALRVDAAPMHVSADAVQLQQVLMNLGINAWHAMAAPHGRISIAVLPARVQEPGVDGPISLPPGRYVHLSVSDNGQGMPEAVRQRIFEPFFTTKPVGQGTGLGLSVVHGIVLAHQGAITVDSSVGVGSVFHVWLPLAEALPAAAASAAPAPIELHGQGQRVMFVDDDELMRLMTGPLLERLGYVPLCFDSAQSALAALRADAQQVELVITDHNMPEVTGLELARAVARLAPALPVVMSSGYIDDALRAEAERCGVRSVLQKEHLLEHLPATLAAVFGARPPARTQPAPAHAD